GRSAGAPIGRRRRARRGRRDLSCGSLDFPPAVAAFRRFCMTSLLRLDGVGKDYAKVDSRGGRLRLVADLLRGRPAAHVFRALDGITLEMSRGESLGVIGENGAGKSTLLKIIAGVIKPTRGTVAINGRVGALLELGSGFHPEHTVRANTDLAATLLVLPPPAI